MLWCFWCDRSFWLALLVWKRCYMCTVLKFVNAIPIFKAAAKLRRFPDPSVLSTAVLHLACTWNFKLTCWRFNVRDVLEWSWGWIGCVHTGSPLQNLALNDPAQWAVRGFFCKIFQILGHFQEILSFNDLFSFSNITVVGWCAWFRGLASDSVREERESERGRD